MSTDQLRVDIADRQTRVATIDHTWQLPIGSVSLVETELDGADRPAPEQLTNALGLVTDHLDDVLRESPDLLAVDDVTFHGRHAIALARVERGDAVPADYRITRADAEEVFRTLVSETTAERLHNPGLDPADVETVIGTCCVVLAFMRRLDLPSAPIATEDGDR